MKTFWIRTASAVVYALLFLGTLLSGRLLGNPQLGLVLFGAFLLFVNAGCTFEFFRMVKTQGARPSRVLGYIFSLTAMLLVIAIPLVDNPLLGFGLVFGRSPCSRRVSPFRPLCSCGNRATSPSAMPPTPWFRCSISACR